MLNLDKHTFTQYDDDKTKKNKKVYRPQDMIRMYVPPTTRIDPWCYPFTIQTKKRFLRLMAYSPFDRDIWMKAFRAFFKQCNEKLEGCNIDTVILDEDTEEPWVFKKEKMIEAEETKGKPDSKEKNQSRNKEKKELESQITLTD